VEEPENEEEEEVSSASSLLIRVHYPVKGWLSG